MRNSSRIPTGCDYVGLV